MPDREYELFFVCGHSRSGTTWVEKILDLHPQINCRGEFHLEILRQAYDTFVQRPWHLASSGHMRQVAEACFEATVRTTLHAVWRRRPQARWIGDRTPRPLRPLIAGAPHILMVRDGRDVAVSYTIHQIRTDGLEMQTPWVKKLFAEDQQALSDNPHHFEEHPERLFRDERWTRHVAAKWGRRCRNDLQTVDRFHAGELDGRTLICRYEDLRADAETERARLYRFLELDPAEAAPLEEGKQTAPGLEHDPVGKNRKGIVGDWRNFAVGKTGETFRTIFKEEAGEELIRLEYERDANW